MVAGAGRLGPDNCPVLYWEVVPPLTAGGEPARFRTPEDALFHVEQCLGRHAADELGEQLAGNGYAVGVAATLTVTIHLRAAGRAEYDGLVPKRLTS